MRAAGLLVCVLAACTYPEKQFAGPFTCVGAPPPTSAEMLVTLQGTAVDPSTLSPLADVMITLQDRNMSPISSLTTDASGGFSFMLNTNGTPVDGVYLAASASGRVDTFHAPSRPVTEDLTIPFAVLSTMQSSSLALGALGMPFTAGTGAVFVTVADCNDRPIAGATVASSPAATVRYFDGIQPSMSATATDAGGVTLIANIPPGKVTLTVTLGERTFPARSFTVVADSFIQTHIQP